MAILPQTTGMVGDPRKILLELAGQHQLSELLPLAVRRLAESPSAALARIWLIQPPQTGDCVACRLASECSQRDHCLHLVASAGRSLLHPDTDWRRLDGAFRRFPIGIRKVGQIAATGRSLEVADVELNHAWAASPDWIRQEQIASFVGHPLLHRGAVLGVLALFFREKPGESCFEWLRMIADHLAAAIANARALEVIEMLKQRLEQENEYLRRGDAVGCLRRLDRAISLIAGCHSPD